MTPEQRELWMRIEAFELDVSGAALPFSARLARENEWSAEFTQRAMKEYKRFVFLAMCAAHPVAPSEEVDQVWHFHLTYTRSYWEELCGQVLPRPLHHGPTRGGKDESAKFHDWYAQTLASYQRFFGEEPPPDLWPEARVRFGKAQWIRVDARRHWVIAKPRWMDAPPKPVASTCSVLKPAKTRWSLALLALLMLIAGCNQVGQAVPVFDFDGPRFLGFYALFAPAVFLGAWVWRRSLLPAAGDVGDHELPQDPYAVALLNSGPQVTLQAALAELARRREVEVAMSGQLSRSLESTAIVGTAAPNSGHPLEVAILNALDTEDGIRLTTLLSNSGVKQALKNLETQLRVNNFLIPEAVASQARNAPLALALLVPVVGATKIIIGLSRDRPVGFLVMMSVVALIVALLVFTRKPFRSARGDKALLRLRLRHGNLKTQRAYRDATHANSAMIPLAVGLYGLGVLEHTPLTDLSLHTRLRNSSGDGSSSSGGGCGSDSGGGDSGCGGGGCGGCGGGGD